MRVGRAQALAFRLSRHHLAERLPPGALLAATAPAALTDTPPGSAAQAMVARVRDVTPEEIDQALRHDRSLLKTWSLRGAPHVFPTEDVALFTTGVLPRDEEDLSFFVAGARTGLEAFPMELSEVVDRVGIALQEALDGRVVSGKDELDTAVARRVESRLDEDTRRQWCSRSPYHADQQLGQALVSFALRLLSLRGLVCFAAGVDGQAVFARTDQWLGSPPPPVDPDTATAGLARRYLRCYGPSTSEHFGEWAGISPRQAAAAWRLVDCETLEVKVDGRRARLLAADLDALGAPPIAEGTRMLPPLDAWVQQRDRDLLLPDRSLHQRLWRRTGWPGTILVDGELVGTWRSRKRGRVLSVTVEALRPLEPRAISRLVDEAQLLAPFHRCASVEVTIT